MQANGSLVQIGSLVKISSLVKTGLLAKAGLCAVLLQGCGAEEGPIGDFIAQKKAQINKETVQLPNSVVFKPFQYQSHSLRNPFELPSAALVPHQPQISNACWQPDERTERSPLERYPLVELKLKGVMSRDGVMSALIQMPDGMLTQVTKGHYMGLNHGQLLEVTSEYVNIKETLPDGLGCWNHRNVKLTLK
ncbi:fimbrial protein [Vibrio sinensis]|uniref:Fimbrial protein n=1 Tax=Vibrio sinensis TaxID=2302434 RepID=A0A3A6QV86_9VIBR|nr:pilus assembly protein PilP [Vibrio sinensis]RJX72319.1 fimbrial protein [Vibrio sinensis]